MLHSNSNHNKERQTLQGILLVVGHCHKRVVAAVDLLEDSKDFFECVECLRQLSLLPRQVADVAQHHGYLWVVTTKVPLLKCQDLLMQRASACLPFSVSAIASWVTAAGLKFLSKRVVCTRA